MNTSYVEQHAGGYRVAGTRVSLDSLVYAFQAGETAEAIAGQFPVLTLEQVYGAIAWYLAHRDEVDASLEATRIESENLRQAAREADPAF